MPQRLTAAPTTRPATTLGSELSIIHAELDEQRRFRTDQLAELTIDAGTGDESRVQVARVLRMVAESALAEIEAAVERLSDGSYGTCERCAEAIASERLEVLPAARLCARCQFLTESGNTRRSRPARVGP
ncbi:MAG: TraR/DksA C4-type zinc finger protein [Propionibacteriaceae bacterium]